MNFRRATTTAAIGVAMALGGAAPAHAATSQWINYIFSAGQTVAGSSGNYRAFVGFSSNGNVVRLNAHNPGTSDPNGGWSQAWGNLCIYWGSVVNYGPLMNNPHTFAQQMQGYVDTNPTVC